MEYKIIEARQPHELEAKVNKLIAQGWKPQGGATCEEYWYTQAMVKSYD